MPKAAITIIVILLIGLVTGATLILRRRAPQQSAVSTTSANSVAIQNNGEQSGLSNSIATRPSAQSSSNTGPLLLKSIGFNLDYYDPKTNQAGDMVFTHADHDLSGHFHLIWSDFGTQDPRSPNDPTKRNPQPTFILPLGTKVHALVDGVVIEVKTLYSGDYTIWVARGQNAAYIYETEHVDKPLVKIGDSVTAGQVIGEVSAHDSQHHPGFGIVEIGILHPNDSRAEHLCPFAYLDPSIKAETQKKIVALHKAWEQYLGQSDLYNDTASASAGCFSLDPVQG